MKRIKEIINSIGFKIAISVTVMCLALFSLVYVTVIKKSEESFITVVKEIPYGIKGQINGYVDSANGYVVNTFPKDILHFDVNGVERPRPLQETFIQNLQSSILWVSVLAICLSFFIGYFASKIFDRPLKQLVEGMNSLRQNKYQLSLQKTGTPEIDIVIDEFNNLATELQKVEVLRKDLISDTSHELKTPLASLLIQLEGIKDGVLKSDEKRISKLIDQVNRLNDLVDRLQEFSKLRSKNKKIEKKKVLLQEVIDNVMEITKENLRREGIQVETNIPKNYKIMADKCMLERVFINLIDNVIAYSRGKKITITAADNQITFDDDGVGVPKESLPYIFERFYRVEKSRNRATGGLGLGLSIVQEIVEAHGWKIEAKNEKGLQIQIKLS